MPTLQLNTDNARQVGTAIVQANANLQTLVSQLANSAAALEAALALSKPLDEKIQWPFERVVHVVSGTRESAPPAGQLFFTMATAIFNTEFPAPPTQLKSIDSQTAQANLIPAAGLLPLPTQATT